MPPCEVRIYQNDEGDVPFLAWLDSLTRPSKGQNLRAAAAVRACVEKLGAHGHALRRPSADYLEREIHELRARVGTVNYRVLYFFHGRAVAVIALGCTKKSEVAKTDIDRAVRYRERYRTNPQRHTYRPHRMLRERIGGPR